MDAKYINAGAGSGKTHTLTHMLAARLVPGGKETLESSRIILTTFTKAAAADFVRKAREVLVNEYNSLDKAAELDSALIRTVHSVCERFVRKYWYRLGLVLPLNVISEGDKNLYVSRTAENVASDGDVKYFTEMARKYEMDPDFWKEYLKSIVELKYHFGVDGFADSCKVSCEDIAALFKADAFGMEAHLDAFLQVMVSAIKAENVKKESLGQKPTLLDELKEAEVLLNGASLYKKAAKVYGWASEGSKKTRGFWNKTFASSTYATVLDAAERILLSEEAGVEWQECIRKLFDLAAKWENEYREFKKENRLLDFDDQEQLFIRILYEDGFADVREDIRKSYDIMMVDEFQDSNPVQIKIFRKLMELVKETVFVGDRKQAIFGFRGTESSLVDEFIDGIADDRKESLKRSFRSRPELVEAANHVFCKAFLKIEPEEVYPDDPEKPYDGISLKPVRPVRKELGPALQLWMAPLKSERSDRCDYVTVGRKIREVVESGTKIVSGKNKEGEEIVSPIQYRDIAILLRGGSYMGDVARAFREAGVPVSVQEKDFIGWAEVQLILSLIRYVMDADDACAKADILHLMRGWSTRDIVADAVSGLKTEDDGLFERLDGIRSRVSVLSVSEIVESLALELDLYGNTSGWGISKTRMRNIGFMCGLARQYESQCTGINATPSLAGYVAFISNYKPEGHPVDRTNSVKILTYHSAKGLEWPMVILDELDSLDTGDQEIFKKEYSGVRQYRKEGRVLLHVFPQVLSKKASKDYFSKAPDLPAPLLCRLAETDFFAYVKKRKVDEERRLLYVGFTRARDYLVSLGNSKSKFTWPLLCNAGCQTCDGDFIWHPDYLFDTMELTSSEISGETEVRTLEPWSFPKKKTFSDKYVSPSKAGHQAPARVILSEKFLGDRMEENIPKDQSDICGTCIHRIFAAFDPDVDRKEMEEMAARIIAGMGLNEAFPSPESVIGSAAQFFKFMREEYGPGTPWHEYPFLLRTGDGTIVRGEMDLVWELPGRKCVLVDYKSYHENENFEDPSAKDKYYGYAPQLKYYKDTLEAGEYTVLDVLIYYFVQGRVIRFEF